MEENQNQVMNIAVLSHVTIARHRYAHWPPLAAVESIAVTEEHAMVMRGIFSPPLVCEVLFCPPFSFSSSDLSPLFCSSVHRRTLSLSLFLGQILIFPSQLYLDSHGFCYFWNPCEYFIVVKNNYFVTTSLMTLVLVYKWCRLSWCLSVPRVSYADCPDVCVPCVSSVLCPEWRLFCPFYQ